MTPYKLGEYPVVRVMKDEYGKLYQLYLNSTALDSISDVMTKQLCYADTTLCNSLVDPYMARVVLNTSLRELP